MKTIMTAALFLLFSNVQAQSMQAAVSTKDFAAIAGMQLKGSLTYKDYGTGKPFTMPADILLMIDAARGNEIIANKTYPKEPKANGTDTIRIEKNGTVLDGEKVISKTKLADGNTEIITETEGTDGNDRKAAVIRHFYLIGEGKYAVRKEVQFKGTSEWIVRHTYSFAR